MNLAQPSSPVGEIEAIEDTEVDETLSDSAQEDAALVADLTSLPSPNAPWMVGQNITWLRRRAALSQTGLGHILGVTRQTVSRWETGQCMPEREHLLGLAKEFGLTPHQLFERLEV